MTDFKSSVQLQQGNNLQVLHAKCYEVRLAILEQAEVAGAGHYGSSLSLVEILVSLYYAFLRVRPQEPDWSARDRFVLSKGHGCTALYPILADLGFFEKSRLATFSKLGSILGDHPDVRKVPGVDFSSGSLGHGLSVGCGMSLAVRAQGHDSKVVIVVGDGETNEGQIWEAAAFAAHKQLNNLLVIMDRNGVQVDASTDEVLNLEPIAQKWRAFGWRVLEADGHDMQELIYLYEQFDRERHSSEMRPTMLVAKTSAGRGIPFIENQAAWHLGYLHGEDRKAALREITKLQLGPQIKE